MFLRIVGQLFFTTLCYNQKIFMNISIIIPNYNGESLLQKNLPIIYEAALGYKKGNVEIVIPDDPSTDGSRKVIKDFINGIKDENIIGKKIENNNLKFSGFSKNVNRGLSISTGDLIVLLNSDVAPNKNFLKYLIEHFKDDRVFAVGCLDESVENGKIVKRGRGLGKFQRGFLIHRAGDIDKGNTLWVSGGSAMFRKSIWYRLGGFDPLYDPFYWEDIDLSYRALKAGYKIVFEPRSIVVHEHEKGVVQTQFKESFIKRIAYRNQFIFMWKNITQLNLVIAHILFLPYHLFKALVTGDINFILGFADAILRWKSISKSRELAKKYFNKSDSEIIKEIS